MVGILYNPSDSSDSTRVESFESLVIQLRSQGKITLCWQGLTPFSQPNAGFPRTVCASFAKAGPSMLHPIKLPMSTAGTTLVQWEQKPYFVAASNQVNGFILNSYQKTLTTWDKKA